jgi:8-oxo-dGTP diphosphatase
MSDPHAESLRRGVVAVIRRAEKFLVIRRSAHVEAPGSYCFPGGGIEDGETEVQALQRELQEELGCQLEPLIRVWQSVTPWHVSLAWWSVPWGSERELRPPPQEVESVHWLTAEELQALPELLVSNRHFLEAWRSGQFTLD